MPSSPATLGLGHGRPLPALAVQAMLAAGLMTGLLAAPAAAQNAIGDGHALDRNLRIGGDGRNYPRAVENFGIRNDLITGDVAGGREFRGGVGYTSDRAFRGRLGSDDLFSFRADSALSSLPAVMGGWTSDRFSLAQGDGIMLFTRDSTPPRVLDESQISRSMQSAYDARVLIDRASVSGQTSQVLRRASEGLIAGDTVDARGQALAVITSPLTGVRYEPVVPGEIMPLEVGLYDWRRHLEELGAPQVDPAVPTAPEGVDPGAGSLFAPEAGAERMEGAVDRRVVQPTRDLRNLGPDYEAIVRGLIERFGQMENVQVSVPGGEIENRLRTELEALRERLGNNAPDFSRTFSGIVPPAPRRSEPLAEPGADPTPEEGDEAMVDEEGADAEAAPTMDDAAIQRMGDLLRGGPTLETFVAPDATGRINELIGIGQRHLQDGDYFLAERAFDQAQRLSPNHPTATAGLVHAQLAAGLHLSASVRLRRFFAARPEMIGTRYADSLLPPPDRIALAVERLQRFVAQGASDAPDYGLALAYLGFQTDDIDLMRLGLDAIVGDEKQDALRLLLKRAWLGE